ncbi:MAG: 4-(cytidine 5'-diphospho)-2-C-methyl-D-erythritol kinase [Bacteroidales bacterium]|nr:4-(cytidine 5'-diphospho)-2-C-methyl-D-erythritol kinase [Bacteroidales bacterium]
MIVFPKAKINLGLQITGRRNDGFHNIETVFYPVNLYDALEFVISPEPSASDILTVTGIAVGVKPEENIVIKAISKLREKYSFPWLKIHLHKVIPQGAGLGGGSSDAACILKSLNRHFELAIGETEIMSIALEIGSDCPFFIYGDPAFASGRGEILEPINPVLSGYYLILVNPGVGINTGEAYRNCRPAVPAENLLQLASRDIKEWKELIINDFEDFAFKKHPVIGKIKDDLYRSGALFSLMSGSGSSVYGIFSGKPGNIPGWLNDMVIWQGEM